MCHPADAHHLGQFVAAVHGGRRYHHRRRAAEGKEKFEYRSVEARRREMQGAVAWFDSEPDSFFVGEAAQPAVTDHDAFGDAGRSRGVDQVSRVVVANA